MMLTFKTSIVGDFPASHVSGHWRVMGMEPTIMIVSWNSGDVVGQRPFRGRGENAHDVNRKSARRYSETMILHIRHVKMHHRRFRKLLVFSS